MSTSTNLVVIFYHLTGGPKLAPNWQPKCPRPSHFRLAVMSVTMSYNLIVGTRVLYSVMYSTHRCRRDRWRSISRRKFREIHAVMPLRTSHTHMQ